MELIDNRNKKLKDDLASELKSGSKMSVAAACFSIYAFQELKKELKDIDELRSKFNVTQLHFVASDGYTNHMRKTVENMDEQMYELYVKYHLATCERPDMIGYSHHTLDIFRKE